MRNGSALLLAVVALLPLRSASAQRVEVGFEGDSLAAFQQMLDAARGSNLPVFGNVPPGVMTDEQRKELLRSLPVFAGTRSGKPVDAVNLVFVGSEEQLKALMKAAKWTAVPSSLRQSLGDVLRGKLNRFPPFSRLFIDGKPQEMNWNHPVSFQSRHHFRVWRSALVDSLGRSVWPGAGIFDRRLEWKPLPDHVGDPNVDEERAYIYASLVDSPLVARLTLVASDKMPHEWKAGGQHRFTDGRVLVVELALPPKN
jgi:hypothetical protein